MEVLFTVLFIGAFIYFLYRGLEFTDLYQQKKNTKLLTEMGGLLVTFDKLAKILKSKGYSPDKDDFNRIHFSRGYFPRGLLFFTITRTKNPDKPFTIDFHNESKAFGQSTTSTNKIDIDPSFSEDKLVDIILQLENSFPIIINELNRRKSTKTQEISINDGISSISHNAKGSVLEDMILHISNNSNSTPKSNVSSIDKDEFGLVESNPIPVQSIMESQIYLGKLRTNRGKLITYSRNGTTITSKIFTPIDRYIIYESKVQIAEIFIWPYAGFTSTKPPKGFILIE